MILRIFSKSRTSGSFDYFDLITKDNGIQFDPRFQDLKVDTDLPVNEREIGGLGLFLVKSSVDQVKYEWQDNHNVYTLSTTI